VHFDTTLNLVWLAVGTIALASIVRVTLRRRKIQKDTRAWLHIIGVGLIVAALFPYISATDDVVRVEQFSGQHGHPFSGKRGPNDELIRLYQTLDTPLVSSTCQVSLTLFFILLVVALVTRQIDRSAPFESGRSPPRLLAV
jgi:hypothetical protein